MTEEINEPVEVTAKFAGGRLTPLLFCRQGRDYLVEQVEFVHSTNEGEARLYFFSVSGLGAIYQLVFNSQTFVWYLKGLEVLQGPTR